MTFAERMLRIDRRIIFLVIGLCTLMPLLFPVGLPIKISSEVRGVYDYLESLPEGSVFLLSLDDGSLTQITSTPDAEVLPRWSPDGRTLAWSLLGGTGGIRLARREPCSSHAPCQRRVNALVTRSAGRCGT